MIYPQPKPDRFVRAAGQRHAARQHRLDRDLFRIRIYRLDEGACRKCGRKVYLKLRDAPCASQVGHVDEWIPRSLGGDDLDERNCLLLCAECHLIGKHGGIGGKQFQIVALDADRLMRGPVEFPPFIGPDEVAAWFRHYQATHPQS